MEKLTRRRSTPTQVPLPSSSFPSLLFNCRIYSVPRMSLEIGADGLEVKQRFYIDLSKKESQCVANGQRTTHWLPNWSFSLISKHLCQWSTDQGKPLENIRLVCKTITRLVKQWLEKGNRMLFGRSKPRYDDHRWPSDWWSPLVGNKLLPSCSNCKDIFQFIQRCPEWLHSWRQLH